MSSSELDQDIDLHLHLQRFRQSMSTQRQLRSSGSLWKSGDKKQPLYGYARSRGYKDLEKEYTSGTKIKPTPPNVPEVRKMTPRRWKVPVPVTNVLSDIDDVKVSEIKSEHSLLDGDYDPEASQASFREALLQWRQSTKSYKTEQVETECLNDRSFDSTALDHTIKELEMEEIETQTSTETKNEKVEDIDFGRSYFDRLKMLKELENTGVMESTNVRSVAKHDCNVNVVEKPQDTDTVIVSEPVPDWDESDQEALNEILFKTKSVAINDKSLEISAPTPPPRWTLTCEDITINEEDIIMDALSKGIMVECIPSCKLTVILS